MKSKKHVPEYRSVIIHFSEYRFLVCRVESELKPSSSGQRDLYWQAVADFFQESLKMSAEISWNG